MNFGMTAIVVYHVLGYEPADLTVHPPPPPQNCREWVHFLFSYRCLVFPKNVLKGKPVLFGIIEVKRPKNVIFQPIHSNPILIILTFLEVFLKKKKLPIVVVRDVCSSVRPSVCPSVHLSVCRLWK